MRGESVTPSYLQMVGQKPTLGRGFLASDYASDAPAVALVSEQLWRTRLGGDPAVIGNSLVTNTLSYEIIGVMPAGFLGTVESDESEFWLPLSQYQPAELNTSRTVRQSYAIARLAPEVTPVAAAEEVRAFGASLAALWPDQYVHLEWRIEAVGENWQSALRANGWLLFAAAAALLLVALVNTIGLAAARAVDRRREFAVRAALGASTGQVARLLFVESALIAVVGAGFGWLCVPPLIALFVATAPLQLPTYLDLSPDLLSMLLLALVCAATALCAGLLPARLTRGADLQGALRDGGRGQAGDRAAGRSTRVLVVAQISLSVLLLVVGTMLVRSYLAFESIDLGFRTDQIRLAMSVSDMDSGGDEDAFRARLTATLERESGVQAVGLVWPTLPPWNGYQPNFHHASLGIREEGSASPRLGGHAVDPGFFEMMGMRLVAGRGIASGDSANKQPVVVISASLAEYLGGAERVLGTELHNLAASGDAPAQPAIARIVGVVSDVCWDGFADQDSGRMIRWENSTDPAAHRRDAYWSLAQVRSPTLSIGVRALGDQGAALMALKRRLGEIAPRSAVQWDSLMSDELASETRTSRFATSLTAAFAISSLGLAALGLFAVISHGVARRSEEFGVRLALGATPQRVLGSVLKDGARLCFIGLIFGFVAAYGASRVLGSLLHGVGSSNLVSYLGTGLFVLVVALLACLRPAQRAARTPPMQALRAN